ncbi:hypothetical protein MGYG_06584 [Nannizzia gypsea CBS 118893]|uniref:Uncharacterized protein n=1 Tax=Arthroderma gypseum (strain ATCC MYA-4604 / CBS 118893) TaxID=535722 RepID=E4V2M8_ARTGP|nr:hypothetical protein MGYG_06584 [Nannizzia gypsea CBS 118893]EFR03590.1 hypothetical protein MGYG_06584 [Nannizzia gypsea CBS 118893]
MRRPQIPRAYLSLILFACLCLQWLPVFALPSSDNFTSIPTRHHHHHLLHHRHHRHHHDHRLGKRVRNPPLPTTEYAKTKMKPGTPHKDKAIFYTANTLFSALHLIQRFNGQGLSDTDNGEKVMSMEGGPFAESAQLFIEDKETWDDDEKDIAIGQVSQAFAERASGIVRVVFPENYSPSVRPNAWTVYEWPALKKNPDVTKVLAWWVKVAGDEPKGDGTEIWPCDMTTDPNRQPF